jgi:transposase
MTHGRYSTDLTDPQWAAIADLVPAPKPGGRPAKYSRREVVNAILYQARNGCTWRDLPKDLPPCRIVFHYFRAWQRAGVWQAVHDRLRGRVRRREGRPAAASAGVLDSQTVKTAGPGEARGYDGGKKGRRAEAAPAG